ncbi:5'-methylthioadenosine/adenosylhomocysteine nucleosidase [Ectobacillus ponti]|uniref:adenosylhomocysteine nucleosidase n=1 Tax=Ectobacillus ponti TaxID=2961894 RepID=A0AA41X7H5_9BACI|nr:5'-methylthioadenosine/adenosylhomocysteine nucleosidase [Ectobacillus ponti]MCP8967703.1 5'-methylthioadenosine/adenosylhomocysteine nucleosidase [Ectobacillus ponti]
MKRALIALLLCMLCAMPGVQAQDGGEMYTIGIIGPMEEEIELIRSKMKVQKVEKLANFTFYSGTWDRQRVVLVRSGIGKVNSSVAAQILIALYRVDFLINSGVAGGLNPKLKVGDIVVSRDAVQHDVDQTAIGEPPGKFEDADVIYYEADPRLVRLGEAAAKGLPGVKVYVGRVASGDQFVGTDEQKQRIVKTFQADAVEMEGGAIGQVAYLNQVPYVIIRSISDASADAAGAEYKSFVKQAARNAAYLIEQMIQNLPKKK